MCARSIFATLLLTLAGLAQAELVSGIVIGVIDGDTIDILDESKTTHRIRLAGIDAPERRQAFGARSKQTLSEMVYGEMVTVDTDKMDRYQRYVGKVLLDGRDVNLELVRLGMAWHFKAYEREHPMADRTSYSDAENNARQARRGLWRDSNPMAPWEFRRTREAKP